MYNQNKEVPIKVKREAGILILSLIIKNFEEKKSPYTYQKLSDRLGMSVFLIKDILSDLEKMGFIHEMFSEKNADIQYHVAYNPTSITINQFMKEFDTKNIEYYSDVFSHLNDEDKRILEDIREKLSMKNMEEGEVKSIAELYANKEYTNPKKLNPNNQLEFEVVPNVENFIEEEENSKEKNKEKIEIVEEEVVQEEKNKENIIKEKEKENEEQKEKLKVEEKSEILESEESSQELNDTVEKMETKEVEKEIKVIEKEEEPISKKTEEKEIKDEKVLEKVSEDITGKEDSEKVVEEKPETNSKESSSFEIPNFEILTTVKARREQKDENSDTNIKDNIDSEDSENEELLFKEADDEIEDDNDNSDLSSNGTKKARFVGGRWRIM